MSEDAARTQELILNLWYVYDDQGLIYSLRVRAYVGEGTEEEKLAFLQRFAASDYLVAQPFPVPARLRILEGSNATEFPVASTAMLEWLETLHDPLALFEEAIRQVEAALPAQTTLEIPRSPLVCLTPLFADDAGTITPRLGGAMRFKDA